MQYNLNGKYLDVQSTNTNSTIWLFHTDEPNGRLFDMSEAETMRKQGWVDTLTDEQKEDDGLSRDELLAEAKSLGLEFFPNIKTPKLKQLIEDAKK